MTNSNGLTEYDLDVIEGVIDKCADDISISIARGLERLGERIDAAEHNIMQDIESLRDVLS